MSRDDLDVRIELVKLAIERIHEADGNFRSVNSDASSSSEGRHQAKERYHSIEREFAWQWRNVEEIFKAKGI